MEFIESKSGDFSIISPVGKLDVTGQKQLESRLLAMIEEGNNKIVIDCAHLTYVSSSGLRVLLIALKKANASGGTLRLSSIHDNVREIMIIAGFSSIFNIFDTPEEAANLNID